MSKPKYSVRIDITSIDAELVKNATAFKSIIEDLGRQEISAITAIYLCISYLERLAMFYSDMMYEKHPNYAKYTLEQIETVRHSISLNELVNYVHQQAPEEQKKRPLLLSKGGTD